MEPENEPLEKEIPLKTIIFRFHVSLERCTPRSSIKYTWVQNAPWVDLRQVTSASAMIVTYSNKPCCEKTVLNLPKTARVLQ